VLIAVYSAYLRAHRILDASKAEESQASRRDVGDATFGFLCGDILKSEAYGTETLLGHVLQESNVR